MGFSQMLLAAGRAVVRAVPSISLIVGVVSLSTMVIFVATAVAVRYITGYSLHFAIEYTEYLIPVLVMWGAAYTMKQKSHITVDLVASNFPARTREWILVIGYILGLVYLIILMKYQLDLALYNISIKSIADYPTKTEIGWVQLVLPIGLALLSFQTVVEIVRMFKHLLSDRHRKDAMTSDNMKVKS